MLQTAERINVLRRMKENRLDLKLTQSFPLRELTAACDRIEGNAQLKTLSPASGIEIHREIIQEPNFCDFYSSLVAAGISDHTITQWLNEAVSCGEVLSGAGTVSEFQALKESKIISCANQYNCLRFFRADVSVPDKLDTLANNLNALQNGGIALSELTPEERRLLQMPFFHDYLCRHTISREVMSCLANNPALQGALSYLYAEDVPLELDERNLRRLKWLCPEDTELFALVFMALESDPQSMGKLICRWLENGAPRYDLEWFAKCNTPIPEEERTAILDTRIGYLNTLYAGKLCVPFERIQDCQTGVLLHAIAQKKRHFLELVNENFDVFSELDYYSLILQEDFYCRCDLNSLTLADMKASTGKWGSAVHLGRLNPGIYTFHELKLLSYAGDIYCSFYNLLAELRIDRRLVVMRELLKKNLLPEDATSEHLQQLAVCFRQKPLHTWREQELHHIQGLSAYDAVRVLRVYDKIGRFLPAMRSWEEAVFAARNADRLAEYAGWEEVQAHIFTLDQDWLYLAEQMKFSDEFIIENQSQIRNFLFREGAEMSRVYYDSSGKRDAFRRIVQAELLGKFYTLKYYPDDLEKEISFPITQAQQLCWQENTQRKSGALTVMEKDDFYTTLRLGELPSQTCLSFRDGMHRECLLSGYDSNKKILLAYRGDDVVARAVIRLTKGTFTDPEKRKTGGTSLEFADLTQDGQERPREDIKEYMTLFLERLYVSRCSPEETEAIRRLFVSLVREKAAAMDALSALASEYHGCIEPGDFAMTGYHLYISKSKSGAQYLDSLSGHATVSREGSYAQGRFLVSLDREAVSAL